MGMTVQALYDAVNGKCEDTDVHMGESISTLSILSRHIETTDQLHKTASHKRKPSYITNYPSTPLSRSCLSFPLASNIWKRDPNRSFLTAPHPYSPLRDPRPEQPRPCYRRHHGRYGCTQLGHSTMVCSTTFETDKTAWRNKVAANKHAIGMTRLNLERRD
jgi:hypothetical protein